MKEAKNNHRSFIQAWWDYCKSFFSSRDHEATTTTINDDITEPGLMRHSLAFMSSADIPDDSDDPHLPDLPPRTKLVPEKMPRKVVVGGHVFTFD